MPKHLLVTASVVLALFAFGCAAEEEPAPAKPAVVAGGTAAPQAYTARVTISPPRVKGATFDCDDVGLCWCVGDEACNDMFSDLPCGTFNSWCNQEMDKCFCDLEGGSYSDYN